ncbi:hypothetical protein HAX54_044816, partial [Datura stramonium]|nr:hypothetical protein [Datura stramonium]
ENFLGQPVQRGMGGYRELEPVPRSHTRPHHPGTIIFTCSEAIATPARATKPSCTTGIWARH